MLIDLNAHVVLLCGLEHQAGDLSIAESYQDSQSVYSQKVINKE